MTSAGARNRRVGLVGNLGGVAAAHDGQTLRTRLVRDELIRRLGKDAVTTADTALLPRHTARFTRALGRVFRHGDIVIVMPAERGLKVLAPTFVALSKLTATPVHYLVVGGWLPAFLQSRPLLSSLLRRFASLQVQSRRMKQQLEAAGFHAVEVLPNFREFAPPHESRQRADPLRLVFLSRVTPDKGVALAVEAVRRLNRRAGRLAMTLEIFGPLLPKHKAWFDDMGIDDDEATTYRGPLEPDRVIDTLRAFDALLFPTWYSGEGFPGVVVEAYAAGIPVIASDWQDNPEVVADGRTGAIVAAKSGEALECAIERLMNDGQYLATLKAGAREEATRYHVDAVIPALLERLGLQQERATR